MIYYYDGLELNEEAFEIYLLNKQLSKEYGEDKAVFIIKQSANKLDYLAKELGAKDIRFFCEYFLSNFFIPNSEAINIRPLSKTHYEIFEELNKIFIDNRNDKEEFILPRGMGKSVVINKAATCWIHCYKRGRYTIVIGKTEDDAVQFISDTKQMLSSKKVINEKSLFRL